MELITGRPIFAAKNERDLLIYHMEVCGVPPAHVLERASRASEFFVRDGEGGYRPIATSDRKGRSRLPGTRSLQSVVQCDDADLVDFLGRCFELDPLKRITPEEALEHPFLSKAPTGRSLVSPMPFQKVSCPLCALDPLHSAPTMLSFHKQSMHSLSPIVHPLARQPLVHSGGMCSR